MNPPRARGPGSQGGGGQLQPAIASSGAGGAWEDTRFAQIVALMESAATQKPRLSTVVDRIARPFLVLVLLAAALAAAWWWPTDPARALMVAVAVLIVLSMRTLSLATPVAMLSAGALARSGVLVRRLQALESLSQVDGGVRQDQHAHARRYGPSRPLGPSWVSDAHALGMAATMAAPVLTPCSRAWCGRRRAGASADWTVSGLQELLAKVCRHWCSVPMAQAHMAWLTTGVRRIHGVQAGDAGGSADSGCVQAVLAQIDDDGQSRMARLCWRGLQAAQAAQAAVTALRQAGMGVVSAVWRPARSRRPVAGRWALSTGGPNCAPVRQSCNAVQALQAQSRRCRHGGRQAQRRSGAGRSACPLSPLGVLCRWPQAQADFVVPGDDLSRWWRTIAPSQQAVKVVRQNLWWAAAYSAASVPWQWLVTCRPGWRVWAWR